MAGNEYAATVRFAQTTCSNAGHEGRRTLDRLATNDEQRDGQGGVSFSLREPTTEDFREAFLVCRGLIRSAIDRLERRTMVEGELVAFGDAMKTAIRDAHRVVLGDDQLTEEVREVMLASEALTGTKVDQFIEEGRDKLRLVREARRFEWKVAIGSALLGFALGVIGTLSTQSLRDAPTPTHETNPQPQSSDQCDENYRGTCVPIVDHDLDCDDLPESEQPFKRVGSDPHGFDSDSDGDACEPPPPSPEP